MDFLKSSPTSNSSLEDLRQSLQTLVAQRDLLELEADAIHSELTSPGLNGEPPAGIRGELIDAEGFPRGDIDLFNVRNKRKRLSEINTDHKAVMKQIQSLMIELQHHMHITQQTSTPTTSTSFSSTTQQSQPVNSTHSHTPPIAKLDEILPGSPAHTAGIQDGDLLIRFGHVNSIDTPNPMQAIAKLVGESVNKSIHILIQRNGQIQEIKLVPQTWGGRGLLGCHLSPIK
jgi:26S proteasome non-ATPase regulatory subunit 9